LYNFELKAFKTYKNERFNTSSRSFGRSVSRSVGRSFGR